MLRVWFMRQKYRSSSRFVSFSTLFWVVGVEPDESPFNHHGKSHLNHIEVFRFFSLAWRWRPRSESLIKTKCSGYVLENGVSTATALLLRCLTWVSHIQIPVGLKHIRPSAVAWAGPPLRPPRPREAGPALSACALLSCCRLSWTPRVVLFVTHLLHCLLGVV